MNVPTHASVSKKERRGPAIHSFFSTLLPPFRLGYRGGGILWPMGSAAESWREGRKKESLGVYFADILLVFAIVQDDR